MIKSNKLKAFTLLQSIFFKPIFLVLFFTIFILISSLIVSLITYKEFDHKSTENQTVFILGSITLSLPQDHLISISVQENNQFKEIINQNIQCTLKNNILNKPLNVSIVEYKYKDFFREGSHIRFVGLKEKICEV